MLTRSAPPFRGFEGDERFAFHDIAVAGEVKRVERPVLRDALRQEFDAPLSSTLRLRSRPFVACRIAGFLLLVIEDALPLDLGCHEQQ